jgi:tyrosine-protein kinase Etk/Wzc
LDNLLKVFKEKHPDVEAKRNEIKRVDEEIENLRKTTDQRVKLASQSSSRRAELQKKNLELENQRLQNQIRLIDQQMEYKNQELAQTASQIASLEAKINAIPSVKVALEGITTQYQSAKQAYDDLLKKSNDASLQVNRESNAQGETIRVQDAANLPESPVAPKRGLLTGLGAAIGLALGLFLAAVFEIPRVLKIQNIEDAKHYTGLPVLASVPPLLSHEEKVWQKRSYWFRVAAGIILAVGAIPLIAMILQATKIFERLVS